MVAPQINKQQETYIKDYPVHSVAYSEFFANSFGLLFTSSELVCLIHFSCPCGTITGINRRVNSPYETRRANSVFVEEELLSDFGSSVLSV